MIALVSSTDCFFEIDVELDYIPDDFSYSIKSLGLWNIYEGADPFAPEVRESIAFNNKLQTYKNLGFDGV